MLKCDLSTAAHCATSSPGPKREISCALDPVGESVDGEARGNILVTELGDLRSRDSSSTETPCQVNHLVGCIGIFREETRE